MVGGLVSLNFIFDVMIQRSLGLVSSLSCKSVVSSQVRWLGSLPPERITTFGEINEKGQLETEFNNYRFTRSPGSKTGYGKNKHRSNQAKRGLFHGKDIQFGNTVSFSIKKTRRTWKPNVINKRVFSFALQDWVRFKMTTRALKEIDRAGGIDNYLLGLDAAQVSDSNYVTKQVNYSPNLSMIRFSNEPISHTHWSSPMHSLQRHLIAATLFHRNELPDKICKRLGFDRCPPTVPSPRDHGIEGDDEEAHIVVE